MGRLAFPFFHRGHNGGEPYILPGCCCPASASLPGSRNCSWDGVWTYRRSSPGPAQLPWPAANVGDVSQQNWGHGNDLNNAYVFAPMAEAKAVAASGRWSGGMNLTALAMLEQRAFGWFHFFSRHANASVAPRLVLSRQASGTTSGLAKMPYLRDTRRSVGLDGFRMYHAAQVGRALWYNDTVALANYPSDCHRIDTCALPGYMNNSYGIPTVPFYIPLRALTNNGSENLLVAGKVMAQSFYANSATRLHPAEWSSGVAAGGTAVVMARQGWASTRQALAHVDVVRTFLNDTVGQALEWAGAQREGMRWCRSLRRFHAPHTRCVSHLLSVAVPSHHSKVYLRRSLCLAAFSRAVRGCRVLPRATPTAPAPGSASRWPPTSGSPMQTTGGGAAGVWWRRRTRT